MLLETIGNVEDFKKYLTHEKNEKRIYRTGNIFKTSNNYYFYDSGTGKIFMIEEYLYNILQKLYDSSVTNMHECTSDDGYLKEFMDIVQRENLLRIPSMEKMISPNHQDDLEYCLNNQLYQLTLEVTGKCNLRCNYCIYNENCLENRNFNNYDMTEETALAAINYAYEHAGEELAITFYGGEPLLRFELIKKCIEYSRALIKNKKLSFSLTTNLTLMTKEIAEYFASVDNFSIVCSIDGPKEIHDSYRKYVNGKGTFSDVINGFELLVNSYKTHNRKGISINSVFAPPYVKEKVDDIFCFWNNFDWLPKDIPISLTYPSEGSIDDISHLEDLKKQKITQDKPWIIAINPLLESYIDKFIQEDICTTDLQKTLLNVHKRYLLEKPSTVYSFNGCCVPGVRRLYVSTGGDLYICEKIGISPPIGNIHNGINLDSIKKYYIIDYAENSIADCSKCWAIRMCSICYVACYKQSGIDINVKRKVCQVEKNQWLRDLALYHEILEHSPEKLDFLNDIIVY